MSFVDSVTGKPTRTRWARSHLYSLSRSITCVVVAAAIGSLFIQPSSLWWYVIDVLSRAYLIFVGTVMAHEGVHGHLGRTRAANFWWGRLALLPSMVPYTNFRKTHHLHHAHTNLPGEDPDHFMKSRHVVEILLRAVAMPHQWFFWLRKRGRITNGDLIELTLNYAGIFAVYGVVLLFVGPSRLFWGLAPALIIVSVLLWYPFAVQTHEGFSTGPAESRSHSYYGRFMYWFSLGLAVHREHHLQPRLSWIELKEYVEEAPHRSEKWPLHLPRRDVRLELQKV